MFQGFAVAVSLLIGTASCSDAGTKGEGRTTATGGAGGATSSAGSGGVSKESMTDAPSPAVSGVAAGAGWNSGGSVATGGVSPVGGAPPGASGGASGAVSSGGASVGGTSGAGGPGLGGTSGAGGPGLGGASGAGGAAGVPTCDLPASFSWTSSPPLITPKSPPGRNFVSIKDPTIVHDGDAYHVFATVFDTTQGLSGGWSSVYLTFTDFSEADAAPQIYMGDLPTGGAVAPEVFYFRPHERWYLVYQWGAKYSTNDDIANPQGWSEPKSLLSGGPSNGIDYWVICDDTDCHLFFSGDDGNLYRSKTSIDDFPNFTGYEIVMSDTQANLFEASNVYRVAGTGQYLLLVEAYGPRYFRSWTAPSLDGPWAPLAATQQSPFAGAANVTFEGADWTDDVSHGEMIRAGYDETLTISACDMRYLYQGVDPEANVPRYDLLPYRLGLLTQSE